MDSLPGIFAASFMVAFTGALAPGPMLSVTVSESLRGGWVSGPFIVIGHGILELILLGLIFMGLGGVLASQRSMAVLGFVGGTALIVMGVMLVAGRHRGAVSHAVGRSRGKAGMALAGALTSISNPYWTLWWATAGLGMLAAAVRLGPLGVLLFFVGHLAADFVWFTFVSSVVSSGREFIGGKAYTHAVAACGVFLAAFGIFFLYGSVV